MPTLKNPRWELFVQNRAEGISIIAALRGAGYACEPYKRSRHGERCYVYPLCDPDTEEAFYIGKGRKSRCMAHGSRISTDPNQAKVERILDIQSRGKELLRLVIECGLSDNGAFALERDLISTIGLANLTNRVNSAIRAPYRGWSLAARASRPASQASGVCVKMQPNACNP